jgi:hypothetical protein
LNRNAEKNETPTLGGNSKNDGASDATNSRGEAQTNVLTNMLISNLEASRHDKNSDASNWNTQFLKPITAESAVNLSNQGMETCVLALHTCMDFLFIFDIFLRF